MKRQIFFAFLIMALCSVSGFAQKKPEKFAMAVKIRISHDSDRVENEMYGYIEKGVKLLNDDKTDVRIANEYGKEWDFTISVVIVDITFNNQKIGYALSVSILQSAKCTFGNIKDVKQKPKIINCDALSSNYVTAIVSTDRLESEVTNVIDAFKKGFGTTQLLFEIDQIVRPPK